ncbi:MAG: N-acetylmuramoyl-L-alanine amidase [Anaerotruncus sp.]|nr:N-acetylmuramoyl-L-alanine amidase [Anaerotruncus sp.]
MNLRLFCKRAAGVLLALSVCVGAMPAVAARTYDDFDYITSHINLKVPSSLNIVRPAEDITTSDSVYFITGTSNPEAELKMDGKTVPNRGSRGSFGILVNLSNGENTFVFQQSGRRKSVTITKGSSTTAPTTKVISSMAPSYDCATTSGSTINLSCTAPAGASVTAVVGGRKVQLEQVAAAREGVPATFQGKTTAGNVEGTQDIGKVTYILNGGTQFQSAGKVFITGQGSTLTVSVKNRAASLYKDEQRSTFIETLKGGAVDTVAEMNSSMYRLSSGGWVYKESMQPLAGQVSVRNKVSKIGRGTSDSWRENGEYYLITGTVNPIYRAYQDQEKLYVRLMHTTGIADQDTSDWTNGSQLFSGVQVSETDGDTILQFQLSGERKLWGYSIEYHDGMTSIYAKYAPKLTSGNQPLENTVIAVDAGHGGTDPGAIGTAGTDAAMEKDITLATAIALQKRLESLGAKVVMCRTGDDDVSMNTRMEITAAKDADLFISLHCNSIGYNQDANKPSGTEVYYYEDIAKPLAVRIADTISEKVGRVNRGGKFSNYRVTLNTFAPSVLVEMGFLTNPKEYDQMTSRNGIYKTVNAIADSVLAVL